MLENNVGSKLFSKEIKSMIDEVFGSRGLGGTQRKTSHAHFTDNIFLRPTVYRTTQKNEWPDEVDLM